jgi:phospholipid-binding lipoprotein MlaA
MRPNGLSLLALATLLAAAPALAQTAPEPAVAPAIETAELPAQDPATPDVDASTQPPATDTPAAAVPMDAPPPAAEPDAEATAPVDAAPAPVAGDGRTDAERDFDALYGAGPQEYDPIADPTLPTPVDMPGAYDPWEKYNRKMHGFNNAVDRRVARPLARGYVRAVPRPVRLGVSNFFSNLGQPVAAVNSLLQGKPKQAGQALGRFVINSTLGIAGIFDPASDARLPHKSEDFGQTLGVWGWKRSRYVELPLFGPRTVRDTLGMVGDAPLSPLRSVDADRVRIPLQGLQLVDVRAQLLSTDSLREGAEDDYTLVRDAWSQRRDYQIFGDRQFNGEDLPEYLRDEESNPTVPVDAMPVMPTDGG